jgi:nitrogen fixation NifU-like protein
MHYDYGQSPDRPTSILNLTILDASTLTPEGKASAGTRFQIEVHSAEVNTTHLYVISTPLARRLQHTRKSTSSSTSWRKPAHNSETNHMNTSLYRPEILRHFAAPANCAEPANYSVKASLHNPVCGDQITLFLTVDSERISGAHFTGSGCAICIASASMMTIKLTGVAVSEAQDYHWAMENVLAGSADDPFVCDVIRPLTAVTPHRGRHKCALLAWRTLDRALVSLSTGGER